MKPGIYQIENRFNTKWYCYKKGVFKTSVSLNIYNERTNFNGISLNFMLNCSSECINTPNLSLSIMSVI